MSDDNAELIAEARKHVDDLASGLVGHMVERTISGNGDDPRVALIVRLATALEAAQPSPVQPTEAETLTDHDREDVGELLGDLDTLRQGEFMLRPADPLDLARLAELAGRAADWIDKLIAPSPVQGTDDEREALAEAITEEFEWVTQGYIGFPGEVIVDFVFSWFASRRSPSVADLTAKAEPWRCNFCGYPWPDGEGNPNMAKYAACSICGGDEWTVRATEPDDMPGFEGLSDALEKLTTRATPVTGEDKA